MKQEFQLDYQFWSKLDNWTYLDAALLLCGFDPDQTKGLGVRLAGRNHPARYAEASKVYRILKSAPDLGHNQAHPFAIVEFALKKSLQMPKALFEAVRERYRLELKFEGWEADENFATHEKANLHPRTRKFLLRLIYVMSSRGYGFTLDKPDNDAKVIAGDAEHIGLLLDSGAVAHSLTEARHLSESGASSG